jgi:hypothetical protein
MQQLLIAICLAFATGGLGGAWLGYRLADGASAKRDAAHQADVITATTATLEAGRVAVRATAIQSGEYLRHDAEIGNRQITERIVYVKSPAPDPVCRLPDDTFGLLVDAVHRANASADSAAAAD